MGCQPDGIDYLNEGIDARSEYRFYWDRDVLSIWFYVGADRKRKTTSLARAEIIDATFRAEARRIASDIVNSAKRGRVLEAAQVDRVQVTSTVDELMEAWLKEQARQYPASIKTRRIQIKNVVRLFSAMDDGMMTPLQRMVDDYGPQLFVNERMRQRDKSTVVKEVGVFFHFLEWLREKKYVSAIPPRPTYRKKDRGTRVGPQRDEPVPLTDDVALKIIKRLPEWASRGGRKDGKSKRPESAFRCRDMMRFAFETGLRPSTVFRLRMGEHWKRGGTSLRITPDIDKSRNEGLARRVRTVPLTKVALEILNRCAPESGLIFGRHDIRVQWKRAAIAVLGEEDGTRCAPYDLRHAAITRMRELGSVTGTMQIAGHARATTSDRYTHANEKAAVEMVRVLDERNRKLERTRVKRS